MLYLSVDTSKALKKLSNLAKQSNFAHVRALTTTASELKKNELPKVMDEQFKGGATAFTKRGFVYERATKIRPYSVVKLKGTNNYLKYQFNGGTKYPNKKRLLIPTNIVRKNKFGNMTKGTRDKIFTNKAKYFTGQPGGKPAGVYERIGRNGRGRIRPVALFANTARYSKNLDIKRIAGEFVGGRYPELYRTYLKQALKS